jgi:peptidyl-prolyl cis-trans isomerase SurA
MKRAKNFILAAIATLCMGSAHAQIVEGVRALVNDEPITTVDVRNRMRLIIASTGMTQLDDEIFARIEEQALRGLIEERLQLQAARDREVQITNEEITNSILNLAQANDTTIEDILTDLQSSGVEVSTLRHQLEAELAWQYLVQGRYYSLIRISEQQIDLALERLAASASQPQYHILEIMIDINSASEVEEAQQRISTIMTQMQRGQVPFPEIARQFSDAQSAANGGNIGWVVASQLRPEVASILPEMEQQYLLSVQQSGGQGGGALSNPIRVSGGYMIIALVGARDGTTTLEFGLTQITVPTSAVSAEATASFTNALNNNPTCEQAESVSTGIPGSFVNEMGAISLGALQSQIRDALSPLREGGNTGVMHTAAGIQALLVCSRRIAGPGVPTRDALEGQLRNQQLSLMSRRWLRDLRRDGTVEIRE